MADEEESSVVERSEFSEETAEKISEESVSDEDLESIASSLSDDGFSAASFQVQDMPTPTLNVDNSIIGDSSSFRQGGRLEDNAKVEGEAPAEKMESRDEKPQRDYINVYNMPDYQGSTSEEDFVVKREEMRKRGMAVRNFEEMTHIQRTVAWDSPEMVGGMRSAGGGSDDYAVIELGRKEDDNVKSPLERRRKYDPKRGL